MDRINVVINISTHNEYAILIVRENGREHAYRNLSPARWWRFIRAINLAMNNNYQAVITADAWMIYRK